MREWVRKNRERINAKRRAESSTKPWRQSAYRKAEAFRKDVAQFVALMRECKVDWPLLMVAIGLIAHDRKRARLERMRKYANEYEKRPEVRARKSEWQRAQRQLKPNVFRAQDARKYAKHGEKIRARVRAYALANPEKKKALRKAHYDANAATYKARAKAWRLAHLEQAKATKRAYRAANHERVLIAERNKNNRRKGAPGRFTRAHIDILFEDQEGLCLYCGAELGEPFHVEHMTPIARGGTNWPCNLCLACAPCNLAKGNKTAEEFLDQRDSAQAA
jgi:5-methylcytosine-specific restriction endonuclease McrA